jgi:hypothetical protein
MVSKYSQLLLNILNIFIYRSSFVNADQPVACLNSHVHDQYWNFYVSKDN